MIKRIALTLGLLVAVTAAQAEVIYSAETTGLVFKDKIHVEMFNDPDYPNVTCYVNLPDRALDWDDQTDTAMSCVTTASFGNVPLKSRRNVFSAKKGLFFKHLQTDRVYDEQNGVLVYLSYTKKTDGDNASSAVTVVNVQR